MVGAGSGAGAGAGRSDARVRVRTLVLAGAAGIALVAAYLIGHVGDGAAQAAAADEPRTVTVVGTGTVSVVPDQLVLNLAIGLTRDDLDSALGDTGAAMAQLVEALGEQGIAAQDIATTGLSTYPEYARGKGAGRTIIGYRAEESMAVTLDDLTRGGDVVAAATSAAGAGLRVDGIALQVADPQSALAPARTKAFDQAKAKAAEYAAQVGAELGEVLGVSELADQGSASRDNFASAADSASASIAIQPGQSDLSARVTVVFALT